jgi:hypothetical protein
LDFSYILDTFALDDFGQNRGACHTNSTSPTIELDIRDLVIFDIHENVDTIATQWIAIMVLYCWVFYFAKVAGMP